MTLHINRKRSKIYTVVGVMFFLLAAAVITGLFIRFEWEKPVLEFELASGSIGSDQGVPGKISDTGSGLGQLKAVLVKDGKEITLLEKKYPKAAFWTKGDVPADNFEIKIQLKDLNIPDGSATLRVTVWDCSWNGWFHGNRTEYEKNVLIDTKPPSLQVLTAQTYVNQGGTGFIIFKTSEPCAKAGVYAGGHFFKGYNGYFPNSPETYLCFFALTHLNTPPGEIYAEASDNAGNRGKAGIRINFRKKNFKTDKIQLTERFLNWSSAGFQVEGKTPLEKFLAVNSQVRSKNAERIMSAGLKSDNTMHWKGAFIRLPNSAQRAGFADERHYMYNSEKVDQQYHLGVDLASLARSEIPAANAGRVALVENIGIYGNSVIIDHGFGILSLYSHMSQTNVQTGQIVEKGQIIGLTGETGLAAGDHLHFSVIVQDMFVNPVEWWDPHWIQDNVKGKIDEARLLTR